MPETENTAEVKEIIDLTLARRCADGDHAAQTYLFNQYRGKIHATCTRITRNPDAAEDVTQEVFIQIFRKIGGFKGEARLSTWIHRLTVNQALMYLRKNQRHIHTESIESDEKVFQIPEPISKTAAKFNLTNKMLLSSCIKQLPAGYKTIFVLREVYGFEITEVAAILAVSEGTVKSQVFKAKAKMRKLMDKKINPRVYAPPLSAFAAA